MDQFRDDEASAAVLEAGGVGRIRMISVQQCKRHAMRVDRNPGTTSAVEWIDGRRGPGRYTAGWRRQSAIQFLIAIHADEEPVRPGDDAECAHRSIQWRSAARKASLIWNTIRLYQIPSCHTYHATSNISGFAKARQLAHSALGGLPRRIVRRKRKFVRF